MTVGHLYIFFGKMSIQVLCPFFNCVVWFFDSRCKSFLYIFDINPFSNISFGNMFSHSVGSLFALLIVSFIVQKLLFDLLIFAFVSLACGNISKELLLRPMTKSVLPMFSSRSFMVSGVTFRFLIHFEFIFVWCEEVAQFDSFM